VSPVTHESVYVYALQRVLCLAVAYQADDDVARLRAAMAEIVAFINHAFAELDRLTLKQR
jgi:hypothetical protein